MKELIALVLNENNGGSQLIIVRQTAWIGLAPLAVVEDLAAWMLLAKPTTSMTIDNIKIIILN